MDEMDSRIIELLQNEFPIEQKPYHILAEKLKISPEKLWEKIRQLKERGLIRRIGASLDSKKLGFSTTLAAVSVQPEKVQKAARIISEFNQVTHCYLRKDSFNIWFTIIAADKKTIDDILDKISTRLSLKNSQILNLPVKRSFKLDTRFKAET